MDFISQRRLNQIIIVQINKGKLFFFSIALFFFSIECEKHRKTLTNLLIISLFNSTKTPESMECYWKNCEYL